jgi:ABC-type transport system substrate-binding protein
MHYTGEARNLSHIDDPVLNKMLINQRLTFDPEERKKIIDDIQRYLAEQSYYVFPPTATSIAVWQAWIHNYAPKSGYDLGRQLEEIWIDES